MAQTTKHIYQITIYTPTINYLFQQSSIHSQYLEDASSKQKIITPTFIQTIKTLKQQFPYTHFTIEAL